MNVFSAILGVIVAVLLVIFIVGQIRGIVRDRKKRKELLNREEKRDGIDERKENE